MDYDNTKYRIVKLEDIIIQKDKTEINILKLTDEIIDSSNISFCLNDFNSIINSNLSAHYSLNLESAKYIDASGIGLLINFSKICKKNNSLDNKDHFSVVNPNNYISNIFKMIYLKKEIKIYSSYSALKNINFWK